MYLSLGSNLGDRAQALATARTRLQHQGWLRLTRCSPLYESEPWGPVAQPPYLNQVCRGQSDLPPRVLLRWLQAVERQGGRCRATEQRWGPRPIDIDLLAYNGSQWHDHALTLPHPRLHERRFVLRPWADIAPEWWHPRLGKTVRQLLAETTDAGYVGRLTMA
ncbi:MAG: 2-amino-4-hydroxy-6-hydroxymethyldihydropteridine diphosphokinase [Ardenticatenales bacterium]|nr:2-amino-4-hydroxy-6-hydroxymethyldihydropteridine diphosphokinase [Ardenticatenales bacterium]MCB9171544.1 2-amino-4-hydroxy-6-hydroxymethyldihydropteridine diphosphokinase [Ardenticatenales bacterium]